MRWFGKKKKTEGQKPDALVWVAFVVSVLSWLLKALEVFPTIPEKTNKDEGADIGNG